MDEASTTNRNIDAIDISSERLIPLRDVPRLKNLPRRRGGKRYHISTIYRWVTRGLRGTRLETIQAGGTQCTSIEALQRFFERLTQRPQPQTPSQPASRRRQIERAAREAEAIFGGRG